MELFIPAQTFDVGKIHLSSFKQMEGRNAISIAPLHYIDQSIKLKNITILTPPLTVINHDTSTGRIQLDTSGQSIFSMKLYTLQEYLLSTLMLHQQTLFGTMFTQDMLKSMFKTLIYKNRLTLFLGASARSLKYVDSTKETIGLTEQIPTGTKVRCAIHLQGIALIPGNPIHFRFQHSLKSIIKCN
jgi:hypothetical protein